ncbi:hypothetical protein HRG_010422 [Hirsutella rhossiliensis]|uniref:DUF2461 domain-containing protein n=1 Tax=Hirsutella rhossiliensis TaxID=111463 RepID=A0A9P8MP69_9HYPO|nr:uncharacterized protein HRG_10422 [Hirsutella rhossiliensis]KAH0958735.1 hypothetical protein HRG_10422 [Hirsutella rhossiliensis]
MPARKRSPVAARRRSGRLSSTPKKSAYFQDDEEEAAVSEDEQQLPPAKKRRGRPRKTQPPPPASEDEDEQYKEDEDEGARDGEDDGDEDEDDEDAPPRVEIIPLEKMRDTGGVAYEDDRLHRNTLLFLKDLKANNKRPWLKSHDGEYRRALKDWQSFVETTTQRIIEIDETVPELPIKDVIFRIHRDIRFSKDPTPYKPHFSAAWSRTGRKGPYACYYVHCEPGSSFVGGGLWHPEAQLVTKLRRNIDRHPGRWRRALGDPLLKKAFFPALKAGAGPEEAVKAFVGKNQDNALKKRPMGWEVTHKDIELLKLRNYTIGTKIDAEMLCGDDAQQRVEELVRAMSGFISFLNSIVMPDPPNLDEDDESSTTDGDEDET